MATYGTSFVYSVSLWHERMTRNIDWYYFKAIL